MASKGDRFEMKNLQSGTYTVEAWHEKLGTRATTVTIDEEEAREVSFSAS